NLAGRGGIDDYTGGSQSWALDPLRLDAVTHRPGAIVTCPSSTTESLWEHEITASPTSVVYRPATATYAFASGTKGPSQHSLAAYDNDGVFMHQRTRRRREITDGLSKTMFAGEIIDGHTLDSKNLWA